MDTAVLKQKIIAKSKELGIDKDWFCFCGAVYALRREYAPFQRTRHTTGFEHPVLEERIYPEKIFDTPKTIISIALAYPTLPKNKPERVKGERRGAFARARGERIITLFFQDAWKPSLTTSKKKFKTKIPDLSRWSTPAN